MDFILLHSLVLIWTSIGAARRLTLRVTDQVLAAALLAWGNIVATSLLLSAFHRLGEPTWFFLTSALLGVLICLLLLLRRSATPNAPSSPEDAATRPNPWLLGAFGLTLAPLAFASLAVACTYAPNNPDALSHQLPRALYYLGQNSLAHFDTADGRQVYLPFDFTLLQLFGLIYNPPIQCLNFFNLAAWGVTGLGSYRLCRLCTFSPNTALITCWLVVSATPVLAQATVTTPDLPTAAGLLCTLVFALQWRQTRRTPDALLAGLALGLTAGSNLKVTFLGLAAGLCLLPWGWRTRFAGWIQNGRPWIASALLACAVGAPFALINLAEKGPWPELGSGLASPRPISETLQAVWLGFLPLLGNPPPLLVLNEDLVGAGLIGPLFLAGALFCLTPYGKSTGPARWLALLGLGWIALSLFLPRCSSALLPDFVSALVLLSPCVAALIEAGRGRRPGPRLAGCALLLVVALTAGWSDGIYLLRNTSRPVMPLLNAAFVPPALPPLPMLLEYHLSAQPRINIDSDGVNEPIFPLMAVRQGQRFTSRRKVDPNSYNILSRASLSRGSGYRDLDRMPSCLLIPLPSKRTAGVEFLATVGTGAAARDYYGVQPHAGNTPPIDGSKFILVTLTSESAPAEDPGAIRLQVAGLNPADHARLVVEAQYIDRLTPNLTLATFTADGASIIPAGKPFWLLAFRALDATTGVEIGSGVIPYLSRATDTAKSADSRLPTSGNSLFATDLVLFRNTSGIASEGLLPTEGPFPQWDLPYIRWARQPTVQLKIPPVPQLTRLALSFSVRLHSRDRGGLEVRFNGEIVHTYRMEGRTAWLDQTLELTAHSGENILEFRDVPLKAESDWQDYLERYPDVKKHLVTNNLPLEQGAREHFAVFGRAEGRTMLTGDLTVPAPDSYYFMFRNIRLEGSKSP